MDVLPSSALRLAFAGNVPVELPPKLAVIAKTYVVHHNLGSLTALVERLLSQEIANDAKLAHRTGRVVRLLQEWKWKAMEEHRFAENRKEGRALVPLRLTADTMLALAKLNEPNVIALNGDVHGEPDKIPAFYSVTSKEKAKLIKAAKSHKMELVTYVSWLMQMRALKATLSAKDYEALANLARNTGKAVQS